MNNAAYWGRREGEPYGMGIGTRNKCHYVVTNESNLFESLFETAVKWWLTVCQTSYYYNLQMLTQHPA